MVVAVEASASGVMKMARTGSLVAFRRHWLLVAVAAAIGLMLAEGALLAATPEYSATSVVYFHAQRGVSGSDLQAGATYAQAQSVSYAELAVSPAVLEPVIAKYALSESASVLANHVAARVVNGTAMVAIVATGDSPAKASVIANAVADSLSKRVSKLSPRNVADQASIAATTVQRATSPTSPSGPRVIRTLALWLLAGIGVGMVLAALREATETRVLSAADVREVTDAPIIGRVATGFAPAGSSAHSFVKSNASGMEEVRRLRTNLSFLGLEQQPTIVVVTSAVGGEGKTSIAAGLSCVLGEVDQRVLLVDADLRGGGDVARVTGLDATVGLSTVLESRVSYTEAVQAWGATGVDVLTAGRPSTSGGRLFESCGMALLLEELGFRYDVIVIDTASLLHAADTAFFARMVSGYLLVARVGRVRSGQLLEARTAVEQVGGRVMGVVMNDVMTSSDHGVRR